MGPVGGEEKSFRLGRRVSCCLFTLLREVAEWWVLEAASNHCEGRLPLPHTVLQGGCVEGLARSI